MEVEQLLDDPRKQRLLEWELTPPATRQPKTLKDLAADMGVSDRTLRDWKDKPEFQAAWRVAFQAIAGSMERTKAILDVLYADSIDPENDKRVQAAKLHWDISRAIAPPEPEQKDSRRARELSDADLLAMLSDAAMEELRERSESRAAGVKAVEPKVEVA